MSEDEVPPPRFAGRTYSRTKQAPASRVDDTADGKGVPLKAAVSISRWGKANYVPFREGSEGSTDAKRIKLEVKPEDPFSFETDDKRKLSPVKKEPVPQPQEPRQSTKLPASRIVVKNDGTEQIVVTKEENVNKSSTLRTYTRTTAKTPIILDQFIEVGKTEITPTGETKFYPGTNLASPRDSSQDAKYSSNEEDDDIYPIEFRREPLKTYSGEVVTPVDKPDSPPLRKSGYKKKGGPRGRKPLTVSDPGLIEEYKRNYAAQQLKGKPDTATGGLNNSTVVFKKEVANEDQGTTVVVVCKPKKQVEKVEVHAKHAIKTNPKPKSSLFTITLDGSQESAGENGNTESTGSTPVQNVAVRTSSRIRNLAHVAADMEGVSSQGSGAVSQSESSTLNRRGANDTIGAADSATSQTISTPSSVDTSQSETLTGRGKRYRIFKSRAPQVDDDLRPPVFGDELEEESPLPVVGEQHLIQNESAQETVVYIELNMTSEDNSSDPACVIPTTVEDCIISEDLSGLKPIDPEAARESLAAKLRNMEKEDHVEFETSNITDCPSPRKSRYKKRDAPPGRKPLTVTDPQLIEECKRNFAAQQQKGKLDTSVDGLNNSKVLFQKEVANEDQGTTVVVVCQPIKQVENVAARPRIQNISQLAAHSEGSQSQSQATPKSGAETASSQSVSTPSSLESDNSAGSSKRYRIFKSRAPHVDEDLKPPVFGDDLDEESPMPASDEQHGVIYLDVDVATAEPSEMEVDPLSIKQIDSSAARESLAARLRTMEKYNDSDSTGDNMSESSENIQSQESPLNSQSTNEEGSQKEAASPPRKFFKSKKFSLSSIDHHRKLLGGSPQKGSPAKVTYNPRTWNNAKDADEEKESNIAKPGLDEDIVLIKDSSKGPKLKREVHYPERTYDEAYTSLRVSKTHKELYTVVHHVKQSHEVQELGETQDFMDEVDYLLDSLQDSKSKSIRCLSCLKLAGKCISPAFRMHMRAHGTVTKIFSLLHDACSDPCLALSTSAMMFMLSRDRLNMDLDRDSLNLMLKLNEVDSADKGNMSTSGDLEKTKVRVQELLAQLQQETHAREIDLGFVSTGNLALESLLSLTSRRAGEWFKEELRSFGGLDHIVDSVTNCEKNLPEDLTQDIQNALPVLRKLDRCLRVLENISFMNSDNQNYLIAYKNAALLQSCTRLLRMCQKCMPTYTVQDSVEENKAVKDTPGFTVLTCMLAVLRVLLNITHEHILGGLDSTHETSLMTTIVKCLTTTQWCVPIEQRFDLAILCLGLLINLVENRETNRQIMMEMETQVKYTEKEQPKTMSAIKAVVQLFVQREQAARELEEDREISSGDTTTAESPNKSGEWKESDSGIQWITNSLKKAREEEGEKSMAPSGSNKSVEGEDANQTILEDDEETFTRALLKAGKHMENSIVASYAGLLLGTTIINNKEYAKTVKQLIPHEDFGPMIKMLKKFLNFMSLTTAFGSTDVNNITKVIDVLESA
ncbi:wings apart-like protein [Biomphalaria pfeifferi]|uniref:Wings apart-like protein n=1 Tax=Biomphalaria pfeifferi TaxID=112525 RepID=A0AAD8F2G6_BIOPF|nr:wings apart-like protein [Biomphalaria pfeifferi]